MHVQSSGLENYSGDFFCPDQFFHCFFFVFCFPLLICFVWKQDTLYQFGDQLSEISSLLLPLYELPGKEWMKHVNQTALSFGLSGTGAGGFEKRAFFFVCKKPFLTLVKVPFHTHGAVFAEVLVGRKRWFVSAPANKPEFSGVNTTLFWLRNVLPQIADKSIILDGICERGDLLYLPSFWWHSTLNIGQCVFMSVFI